MDEELDDISSLVEKYEQMRMFGRKIYFDADEFAVLADHYNGLGDNEQAQDASSQSGVDDFKGQDIGLLRVV